MSSRFVSSGTIDPTSGHHVDNAEARAPGADGTRAERNKEAWEAVQREVEEERKRRAAEKGTGDGGKSLYEILQENKAAKQAAFEEKTKLSNQFRALDDDEVEFLDDVQRAKRDEEERLRRETEEGLKAFREAQKSEGRGGEGAGGEVEDWGVGRKRKRKEKEGRGVRRRVSSGVKEGLADGDNEGSAGGANEEKTGSVKGMSEGKESEKTEATKPAAVDKKPKLGGLVDYGSDESE